MIAQARYFDTKMVFVYGLLKEGYKGHVAMERANARYVGEHTTEDKYFMYDLGAYPGVVYGGVTAIKGEVWEVDLLSPIDRYEGYPYNFDRTLIETPYGPAWMYTVGPTNVAGISKFDRIHTGRWIRA